MHDDMHRLDRQLAARASRERRVGLTLARAHRDDAATIARRHGDELHVTDVDEPGCVWVEFWPVVVGVPAGAPVRRGRRPPA